MFGHNLRAFLVLCFYFGSMWRERIVCVSAEPFLNRPYFHSIWSPPQPTTIGVFTVYDNYWHKIDYVKEFPNYIFAYQIVVNTCEKLDNGRRQKKFFCRHVIRWSISSTKLTDGEVPLSRETVLILGMIFIRFLYFAVRRSFDRISSTLKFKQ